MMKKRKIHLVILAIVSTCVALGASELAVRLLGFQPLFHVYSKPSVLWQYHPHLGWAHTPNSSDVFKGPRPFPIQFKTPISINSHGLRGPELSMDRSVGQRIIFAGDSMVAAFEVPFQETFPSRIGKGITERSGLKVEVINAGVRGYGTDQSYLWYLNYGRLLSPAVVFFYHSANDPRNNVTLHRMRRPFGKGAFAPTPNAQLQQIGFPIPDYPLCSHFGLNEYFEIARFDFPHQRAFCLLQSVIFEHSALFSLVSINIARLPMLTSKLYNLGSTSEDPRDNEYPFELTTAILASFISEVKKDGATFVLFGERKHLLRLDLQRLQQLTSSIYFQEEALGNGPMEPWIFKHDAHFNSKGHEKLADFLIPKLISELKVLPESVP